jgi:hypothetical protein
MHYLLNNSNRGPFEILLEIKKIQKGEKMHSFCVLKTRKLKCDHVLKTFPLNIIH